MVISAVNLLQKRNAASLFPLEKTLLRIILSNSVSLFRITGPNAPLITFIDFINNHLPTFFILTLRGFNDLFPIPSTGIASKFILRQITFTSGP